MTQASEFTFDQALAVANTAMTNRMQCQLSDVETLLLRGAWQGMTYEEIADESAYSASYLRRNVGPKLWKTLSKALEQPVSKTSFREALERTRQQQQQTKLERQERSLGFNVPAYPAKEDAQSSQLGKALNLDLSLNAPAALGEQALVQQQRISSLPQPAAQTVSGLNNTVKVAPQPSPTVARQLADQLTYRADWGEAIDVSIFFGRDAELNQLTQMVEQDRCRLLAVLGMGGIGKTSLTVKLAQQVAHDFEFVIWHSLRNAPTLDGLVTDCLQFFSTQQVVDGDLKLLLQYLKNHRCLVVLDNMETILRSEERAGVFRQGYEDYGNLLRLVAEVPHQSCVVLTSREKPAQIATFEGVELAVRSHILKGAQDVAMKLLDAKGVMGSPMAQQQLCDRYGSSPLAMKIVATSIQDLYDGDIQQFLDQETNVFNGLQRLLDQHFQRLSPLERTVMFWLAINRELTSIPELMADIYPPCSNRELLGTVESLCWRSLIERRGNAYTQQPVVMEYVTIGLIEAVSDELLHTDYFNEMPVDDASELPHVSAHALIKATSQDFVRASQCRLILQPIFEQISEKLSPTALVQQIQALLTAVRRTGIHRSGYAGGNLLNLCCQAQLETTGFDFSELTIRQAYLRGATLHGLDLSQTQFVHSVFTQAFGSALCVAFSPDGTLLAMGDNNYNNIQIWRVADRQPLMTLEGHEMWVWSVAFSPDGKTLVSGSVDYTVRLWDLSSGQCLHVLQDHDSVVWSVAFSPDGQRLASGSEDQTAKLWDATTGECIHTLESQGGLVSSVAFNPQGTHLATGHAAQVVRWWDVSSGDCLRVFEGHRAPVWSIALHPTQQILASAGADQTIRLWDIETGDCLSILTAHSDQIWSLAFSPDGQMLASGSHDQTVRLWDLQTKNCLATLLGHTDQIWAVGFSPDGRQLASGSFDQTIRIWDVETQQCAQTLQGYTNCIRALTFSDDFTLVSGGDDGIIRLWDSRTGQCLKSLEGHRSGVWTMAYQHKKDSRSGDLKPIVATGGFDQTIRLWDGDTGRVIQVLEGRAGWVRTVAFHPQGKLLASGSIQPVVQIWDLTTGQCSQQLSGHANQLWAVAFSPDGKHLASAGADHLIKLWDVESGECVQTLQGHTDWVYAVTFGPFRSNGTVNGLPNAWLASGSADSTIKLWDLESGKCFRTLTAHTGWIYAMSLHPDGNLLVSASYDTTVRIWDVQTGDCLHVLAHDANPFSIAIHPKGHLLTTSGEDEKIILWDVASGSRLSTFHIPKPYADMRITNVTGLTEAQKSALKALGAVE
ncbi:MAG: NB-ARC domain-containing protein [Cyanobacteria bacterium P01_B01_bin.77]